MQIILRILFILLILLLYFSCNSVEPDGNIVYTTSHNFTWQAWTFGEHSSSVLYDVAIIDENNIWAVREIYMNDTLGNPDPHAYNAVHWDGSEWELKRIYYYGNCSVVDYPPLKAIWAFSESELVVTNGGSIGWFDGNTLTLDCLINPLLSGSINKIWGSSYNDLYIVGNNGSIAHNQNGIWSSIESGTDLDVYDIWGEHNSINGGYEIIAVAAKQFISFDKKILKINGSTVQNINTDSIPYSLHGLWFKSGKKYFVTGAGLYSKNNINPTSDWEWLHPEVTNYYLYAIRGQDSNDLFACGAFGEMIHYNGSTWRSFIEETGISNGAFNNIAFKQDLVIAVGYDSPKAVNNYGEKKLKLTSSRISLMQQLCIFLKRNFNCTKHF